MLNRILKTAWGSTTRITTSASATPGTLYRPRYVFVWYTATGDSNRRSLEVQVADLTRRQMGRFWSQLPVRGITGGEMNQKPSSIDFTLDRNNKLASAKSGSVRQSEWEYLLSPARFLSLPVAMLWCHRALRLARCPTGENGARQMLPGTLQRVRSQRHQHILVTGSSLIWCKPTSKYFNAFKCASYYTFPLKWVLMRFISDVLGLLWEGRGMAERQQTFAWNHRNVCPGLTGTFKHTNITIKSFLYAWNDVISCLARGWCHFLFPAASWNGLLHDLIPADPQSGKEVRRLESVNFQNTCVFHVRFDAITRFYPATWNIKTLKPIRFNYVELTVDIFSQLPSGWCFFGLTFNSIFKRKTNEENCFWEAAMDVCACLDRFSSKSFFGPETVR